MNSFCYTVYVIVMLLRRREAEERGEMKARGTMGSKKKERPFPSSHSPLRA